MKLYLDIVTITIIGGTQAIRTLSAKGIDATQRYIIGLLRQYISQFLIFLQEHAFENVDCKSSILSWSQCVDLKTQCDYVVPDEGNRASTHQMRTFSTVVACPSDHQDLFY